MEIIISNNSSKPIYEQITSQMKSMIMNGQLQAGDAIPSMRALAKSLHISVITVQKAYEDLQRDGFIETTVGRGSFVSARTAAKGRGIFAGGCGNSPCLRYSVGKAPGNTGTVL